MRMEARPQGRIPMAQAPAVDTDELLSQLAASEIDRLLAEADGKGNSAATPASTGEAIADGPERAALLQAAGFDSPKAAGSETSDTVIGQPTGDERSALLRAAGFESNNSQSDKAAKAAPPPAAAKTDDYDRPLPIFLKPLEWISAPLDACHPAIRSMVGKAGLLTLVNAIAVLAYLFFTRRH
jgi:hypothetical protein